MFESWSMTAGLRQCGIALGENCLFGHEPSICYRGWLNLTRTFDMPTSFLVGYAVQDKGLEHCPMSTCNIFAYLEIMKTEMKSLKEASFDLIETIILGFRVYHFFRAFKMQKTSRSGIIEMRLRKIAWNYLRSWFLLDITIVAIVPASIGKGW